MVGSPMPPSGFRWVDQSRHTGRRGAKLRRQGRRWRVVAVLIAAAAVVVGGVAAVQWWSADRSTTGVSPAAQAAIGTPKDLLVSFPLDRQPVTGWQVSATDLGLPPGNLGALFASNGDKAYFLAERGCERGSDCSDPVGMVYGIDTATGIGLFEPIVLRNMIGGNCHANGPSVAVCIYKPVERIKVEQPPPALWVIDLERGELTFTGPSEFDLSTGPKLIDVGSRRGTSWLVAQVDGEGAYGVGAQGELTWSVPANGAARIPDFYRESDVPPQTLAVQQSIDVSRRVTGQVFSVIDGTELTPAAPVGATLGKPIVYNGGFAYEFEDQAGNAGTLFFDSGGAFVHEQQSATERVRVQNNPAMPTVLVGSTLHVYTATGRPVLQIPVIGTTLDTRIIGTKIYVSQGESIGTQQWQQWDLFTGAPGATCDMRLGAEYVASDGNVIITARDAAGDVVAIDPATCRTLWRVPELTQIWKVGSGLIQSGPERMTISSLRAPE